jgi:hypothetical protein
MAWNVQNPPGLFVRQRPDNLFTPESCMKPVATAAVSQALAAVLS